MHIDVRRFTLLYLAVVLSGCKLGSSSENEYVVRIHQVRCPEGVTADSPPKCKQKTADAGVLDFRLFPTQRRALVRVVTQENHNPSIDLFELQNCIVWDASNWTCSMGDSGFMISYELRNGSYKHMFGGAATGFTHYVGTVREESFVQRLISR